MALAGVATIEPVLRAIGTAPEVASARGALCLRCGLRPAGDVRVPRASFSSEGYRLTRPILFTAVPSPRRQRVRPLAFIYGHFGMPALGAVGSGVATAITQMGSSRKLWTYIRRHRAYRPYAPLDRFEWPDRQRLREILALGLPICGSALPRARCSPSAGLLMAASEATVVAAHAIAINYAALMFMVPLSVHPRPRSTPATRRRGALA